MRSLQRILFERKTRRFVDEMIHNYADIRLSSGLTTWSRKRQRSEVEDTHKGESNQEPGQTECSTSSRCWTESERSSRISSSMMDSERSQIGKGSDRQQQQDEERWRVSEARTVSEYGSAFSSTRLTRLLEEEDDENDEDNNQDETSASRRDSDSNSEASSVHGIEGNQRHHSSFSECDTTSTDLESAPASTQPSEGSQLEDNLLSATASARLPRLRPTPPTKRVIPNCCDFFTSPHPHFAKEVIGACNGEVSSHSVLTRTNSIRSDTSEGRNDSGNSDPSTANTTDEEFEMWDYVCPQYARRAYANEWV
ncbi:hypothetical protein KRP22_001401 [Phytophthora ramorum]|uniref:Uncharacterized protein n=1 Tax=Phytophthora ramorum TaxID=164328 RepID=H3GCY8_PHYRM|nr:hypothetical protein KRP23_9893 [Phytophthora ramorum]KAH7504144.1 hypothetical protein KRP22_7190 [Phytophthora ramorum]